MPQIKQCTLSIGLLIAYVTKAKRLPIRSAVAHTHGAMLAWWQPCVRLNLDFLSLLLKLK
jgi:hypothetical protein